MQWGRRRWGNKRGEKGEVGRRRGEKEKKKKKNKEKSDKKRLISERVSILNICLFSDAMIERKRKEKQEKKYKGNGGKGTKCARACKRSTRQTLMGARGELRTLYQGNIFPSPLPVKNYAFYGFRSRM